MTLNGNEVADLINKFSKLRTAEIEAFLVETLHTHLSPDAFDKLRDAINGEKFCEAAAIIESNQIKTQVKENNTRWIGITIAGNLVAEKILEAMPWESDSPTFQ